MAIRSRSSMSLAVSSRLAPLNESQEHDRKGDKEPELLDAQVASLRGDIHAGELRLQRAGA